MRDQTEQYQTDIGDNDPEECHIHNRKGPQDDLGGNVRHRPDNGCKYSGQVAFHGAAHGICPFRS